MKAYQSSVPKYGFDESLLGKTTCRPRMYRRFSSLFTMLLVAAAILLPNIGRSQTADDLQQQIASAQQQIDSLQQDNAMLTQQQTSLQSQWDAKSNSVMFLMMDVESESLSMDTSADQLNSLFDQNQVTIAVDQITLIELQEDADALDPNSPTYDSDFDSLENQAEQVQGNIDSLNDQYDEAMADFDGLVADYLADSQELANSNADDASLEQQIDAIQPMIDSNNDMIQTLQAQIADLQGLLNGM